jgi:hypothetical protein
MAFPSALTYKEYVTSMKNYLSMNTKKNVENFMTAFLNGKSQALITDRHNNS